MSRRLHIGELFDVLLKAEIVHCLGAAIDQPKGKKSDWLPLLGEQFQNQKALPNGARHWMTDCSP